MSSRQRKRKHLEHSFNIRNQTKIRRKIPRKKNPRGSKQVPSRHLQTQPNIFKAFKVFLAM